MVDSLSTGPGGESRSTKQGTPDRHDFEGLGRDEAIEKLREVAPTLSLSERFILLDELGIYHGAESRSGPGSSLTETAELRTALPRLVEEYAVRTLLDIPCGDFHWMQKVDLGAVEYLGCDIVPEVIRQNRERFETETRTFLVLDATRDTLPEVDLVICRDLLVHLSLGDIGRVLRNFVESGSRLLLASHFVDCTENSDIQSGDFRPINLCLPPFDFPEPVQLIDEQSRMVEAASRGRSMALWSLGIVKGLSFLQN